jgi:hypothetical protein
VLGHRTEAHRAAGPEPHVLDGITQDVATTDSACDEFIEKFPRGRRDSRLRRLQRPQSRRALAQVELHDHRGTAQRGGPVTLKRADAEPAGASRLSAVNRLLKNANGVTRLWIRKWDPARTCPTRQLVRSLQRSKMPPGKQEVEKKPGETITHAGEALGYWIARGMAGAEAESRAGGMTVDWLN